MVSFTDYPDLQNFTWSDYLSKTKSVPVPTRAFKPVSLTSDFVFCIHVHVCAYKLSKCMEAQLCEWRSFLLLTKTSFHCNISLFAQRKDVNACAWQENWQCENFLLCSFLAGGCQFPFSWYANHICQYLPSSSRSIDPLSCALFSYDYCFTPELL